MFRGIVSHTRLSRHAVTMATAMTTANGAAVLDGLSSIGSHTADVNNTSLLRNSAEEVMLDTQHVNAATEFNTASDSTHFLQDMLNNYLGRYHQGRASHNATDDELAPSVGVAATTGSASASSAVPALSVSSSNPARRRPATIMSKARRIRLAAAAQEAAEQLQEASSPASAMVHSQHVDELRAEEKLLEVSLQRLRAERDLAVSRHDCEADLRRFRQGVRDREEAVAAMVKDKLASLHAGRSASIVGEIGGQSLKRNAHSSSGAATTTTTAASSSSSDISSAAAKSHVVYQQGSLDVRDEEHAAADGVEAGGIDVEEAVAMRFLIDMDATADADAALESAAAAAIGSHSTARPTKGTPRRCQTKPARSPPSSRKTVKKTAAAAAAAASVIKLNLKSAAKKPKTKKSVAPTTSKKKKAAPRAPARRATTPAKKRAHPAKHVTPKKKSPTTVKSKKSTKPTRAVASKRKGPSKTSRTGRK